MKYFLLLFILFSIKIKSHGSETTDTLLNYGNIDNGRYRRISILPTGLHYEMMANKKVSVLLSVQLDHTFGFGYYSGNFHYIYLVNPSFKAAYRYYYNLNKRIRKKKNIAFRSLNYVGILLENNGYGYDHSKKNYYSKKYYKETFFKNEISRIGPVWGFQRSLGAKKRMYWSFEIGIGYRLSERQKFKNSTIYSDWNLIGDFFSFGFII